MQQKISLQVLPSEEANEVVFKNIIAEACAVKMERITGYSILKKSIDARGRNVKLNLTVLIFIDEPFHPEQLLPFHLQDVHKAGKKAIIIGTGPAGLFAAIQLIEAGIKPILLERGKDVRARRRDLALMNKEGVVNPESNYCFGEGCAGTYSDGKLYTRSNKRGDINRILSILVHFGATHKILYEAHPHIGTNKLPHIITSIREKIIECGGEVLFEKKLVGLVIARDEAKGIKTAGGDVFHGDAIILATGHSARDIFTLLHANNIHIEAK